MSGQSQSSPLVFPCDQCLQRKVRCDKQLPQCQRCIDSNLNCTRDVVRKRPGRKKGSGTVISKLRSDPEGSLDESRGSQEVRAEARSSVEPESPVAGPPRTPGEVSATVGSPSNSTSLSDIPSAILSSLPNLTQEVNRFLKELYPIWPIFDPIHILRWIEHPDQVAQSQACFILSICALSALHIPDSISMSEVPRQTRAQRFIRQALQLRANFDYIETATLITVQTSLFLSVAQVEVQKVRSSWFLLREAIMLAQDLRYYDYERVTSAKLGLSEYLGIQRTLYILSLTERGLTLLRQKPFAIVMFPNPPNARFDNEDPRILIGLQSTAQLFNPLDTQFLDIFMAGSAVIATPETRDRILAAQTTLQDLRFALENLTDIQKADILIAQQWLRLVFWQLSMRQSLLSSSSANPYLTYQFPCVVAKSLCVALGHISMAAVFLHGMAIFERIFEITFSFIDSLCLTQSLESGLEELRVLFRVLRESPNSHNTYIKILEAKLIEQAGQNGHGIIPQIHQRLLV